MTNQAAASTEEGKTTEEGKQPTPEELAQAEKDAEAQFAAGYTKVAGNGADPDPDPEKKSEDKDDKQDTTTSTGTAAAAAAAAPAGEKTDDAAAAAAAAAAPAKDPWEGVHPVVKQQLEELGKLPGQIRNLAGSFGGLKSQIDSVLATAKAAATEAGGAKAAPSDKQVAAAMSDPKAWEKLKEDYPDWAGPLEAEFAALRTELGKAKQPAVDVHAIAQTVATTVRSALAFEAVDDAHAGWRDTVKTPEFAGWLKSQPADMQARAKSERAKDAITLLDGFKAHQTQAAKAAQDAEAERLRKQKRLEGGLTPKGAPASPSTGLSDDQAFERGFKKVRAKA